MPITIKNDRAEKLAREVAAETGESLTDAVIHSLEERLERLKGLRSAPGLPATLMDIGGSTRAPLGSRLAARFRDLGFEEDIPELSDEELHAVKRISDG